jgi:hypothetical protein
MFNPATEHQLGHHQETLPVIINYLFYFYIFCNEEWHQGTLFLENENHVLLLTTVGLKNSHVGICVTDEFPGPDSHFINEGEIMQWKALLC